MEHPSGQQFILRHGEQHAVITEVGGGLRSYRVGNIDMLDGFAETEICDGARGQTLLPWPNRVKDGRYRWNGHDEQLPLTEPEKHNAIHGLTRWANWELIELTSASIHLRHRLHAQTGWPFLLRCDLHYSLDQDGLTVHTNVTNLGNQPSPLAAGAHPYLSAGGALIDDCELTVPADTFLPTDERGIPTGWLPVAGTDHDFRLPRRLGTMQIDETYTGMHRGDTDRAVVKLARPDGTTVQLWADKSYPHLEIFTGDTFTSKRGRRGLGVEPMTAPPNALATGEDLLTLQPQQTVEFRWGVCAI